MDYVIYVIFVRYCGWNTGWITGWITWCCIVDVLFVRYIRKIVFAVIFVRYIRKILWMDYWMDYWMDHLVLA